MLEKIIQVGKLRFMMGKELTQVPRVRTLKWSLIRFINEKIGAVLSLPL